MILSPIWKNSALQKMKLGLVMVVCIIKSQNYVNKAKTVSHLFWAIPGTFHSLSAAASCPYLCTYVFLSLSLFSLCSPAKASPDLIATLSLYCSILMNRTGDIAFCLQCYYTNHSLMWPSNDTNKHKYWRADSSVARDPSPYWTPGECA